MAMFGMSRVLFFILIFAAVGIALGVAAAAAGRGKNVFKMQGVAWLVTLVLVAVSIGIGYAKAPVNNPAPEPDSPAPTVPPNATPAIPVEHYVRDDAGVLSGQTERVLNDRNTRLMDGYGVLIGVVTCDYGRDDLYDYAINQMDDMGLGSYDFIVVLDISGENYWLVQGAGLVRDFTDSDCSDYAYDYMEDFFAREMYDDAVLSLTEALEVWYGDNYR